ncbi:hypothetical protein Cadr_000009698 [Camelus dromedarius]|uniref:Uncharacterized protein n=1 Tax=Camelus dromedarius TaxID=9838 RepID=A0A5N4DJK6_CAMDR|nr:hypothetical protein Cadr_000009698 [Camelus dromedarius]
MQLVAFLPPGIPLRWALLTQLLHEKSEAQGAWSPGLSGSWPDAVTLVMDPQPIHPWLYWQNHLKVEAGERGLAAWAPGVPSCLWFQRRPCSVSIGVSKQGPSASPCQEASRPGLRHSSLQNLEISFPGHELGASSEKLTEACVSWKGASLPKPPRLLSAEFSAGPWGPYWKVLSWLHGLMAPLRAASRVSFWQRHWVPLGKTSLFICSPLEVFGWRPVPVCSHGLEGDRRGLRPGDSPANLSWKEHCSPGIPLLSTLRKWAPSWGPGRAGEHCSFGPTPRYLSTAVLLPGGTVWDQICGQLCTRFQTPQSPPQRGHGHSRCHLAAVCTGHVPELPRPLGLPDSTWHTVGASSMQMNKGTSTMCQCWRSRGSADLQQVSSARWSGPRAGGQLTVGHCPEEETKRLLGWDVRPGGQAEEEAAGESGAQFGPWACLWACAFVQQLGFQLWGLWVRSKPGPRLCPCTAHLAALLSSIPACLHTQEDSRQCPRAALPLLASYPSGQREMEQGIRTIRGSERVGQGHRDRNGPKRTKGVLCLRAAGLLCLIAALTAAALSLGWFGWEAASEGRLGSPWGREMREAQQSLLFFLPCHSRLRAGEGSGAH